MTVRLTLPLAEAVSPAEAETPLLVALVMVKLVGESLGHFQKLSCISPLNPPSYFRQTLPLSLSIR